MAPRKKTVKQNFPGTAELTPGTRSLVIDKLVSSGLDLDDMVRLGMTPLETAGTLRLDPKFRPVPSIKLNYWDPLNPEKLLTPRPGWPGFYRLRYLETPQDFAALTEKKPQRYIQPEGSGVCAYFPRSSEWKEIFKDVSRPIIITEGEFKAAKAMKAGYPTIGLGGVDSFKSVQLGETFLAELEKIDWVKRFVYVIYDSDFRSNENVCGAINRLADELEDRGAISLVVSLPDVVENGKTGLDDFLCQATGVDDLGDLLRTSAQPLSLVRSLWKINDEVTYICQPGIVVVKETNFKLTPTAFANHAFSTARYAENVMGKDGKMSLRPVPAGMAWLSWPLRSEAGSMTYSPGKPRYIAGCDRWSSSWNIWPGWGCKPVKGDVSPFLKLVDHIFTGASKEAVEWFLCWCAHPLQYPGVKLFSAAVIYGIKHGTGKSLLGYTLGRIYGKNFTEIKGSDLHGNFNEWAEAKQFVMGDDVTGSNKREDNDILKKLITQKGLRVNTKFIPTYEVADCINYLFTSNQPDSFFLEDDDRRFFIHEVVVKPLPDEFYLEYQLWLDSGGAEALFYYLLHLKIDQFNPAGRAFLTDAKERMIHDVKSDLGAWVNRLLTTPEAVLRLGDLKIEGDLFTNRHLLEIYDPSGKTKTTANGLGRELRRAGAVQVCRGRPIKIGVTQDRYYAVRNRERWADATMAEVTTHLEKLQLKVVAVKEAKY